jgi:hypothetical protein
MTSYDFLQFLAYDAWMNEHASEFTNKIDILENRFKMYQNIVLNDDIHHDIVVWSVLTHSFYWVFDNGWEVEGNTVTIRPKSFDFNINMLKTIQFDNKYAPIYDELDMIVSTYFAREHKKIIDHLQALGG